MPPNNQPTVHQVEQDLARCPEGTEKLLVGNLNDCLAQPHEQHEEDLATSIAKHGLEDQTLYFIPWRIYRGGGGVGVEDV